MVKAPGGEQELAKQARELADKWLVDRRAVPPEVAGTILNTAAYYGDIALFNRLLGDDTAGTELTVVASA